MSVTPHTSKFYLIASIPVFQDLKDAEISYLAQNTKLLEYKSGEFLYKKGEREDNLFFLLTGQVGIFSKDGKKEKPVETFRRGEAIGMVAFLNEEKHHYNAIALNDIRVLAFRKNVYQKIVKKIPSLGFKFSKLLSQRLRNLRSRKNDSSLTKIIGIVNYLPEEDFAKSFIKVVRNTNHRNKKKTITLLVRSKASSITGQTARGEIILDSHLPLAKLIGDYIGQYDVIFLRFDPSETKKNRAVEELADRIYVFSKEETSIHTDNPYLYRHVQIDSHWEDEFLDNNTYILSREIINKRIGLALGGGAALGMAQIGILKVLERENIPIDMISGTSIGSLIGGLFSSGMKATEIEKLCLEFDNAFKMFKLVDLGIPGRGMLTGKKLVEFLEVYLKGVEFSGLKIPFRAVACDIQRRQEIVLSAGKVSQAIRMSTAIPGVFSPVEWQERLIVDGGIVNPLPVNVLSGEGINRIIAVNSMPSSDVLMKSDKGSPNIMDIMINSLYSLQYRIGKHAIDQSDVYLNPILENSSWYEFYRAKEFIRVGEEAAESALPEIKRLLS